MKTILNKKTNEVKRVKEHEVDKFINLGWSYCPKSEWKKLNEKSKQSDKK